MLSYFSPGDGEVVGEDPAPGAGVEGEAGVHRVIVIPPVLAPAPAHTPAHQQPAA